MSAPSFKNVLPSRLPLKPCTISLTACVAWLFSTSSAAVLFSASMLSAFRLVLVLPSVNVARIFRCSMRMCDSWYISDSRSAKKTSWCEMGTTHNHQSHTWYLLRSLDKLHIVLLACLLERGRSLLIVGLNFFLTLLQIASTHTFPSKLLCICAQS